MERFENGKRENRESILEKKITDLNPDNNIMNVILKLASEIGKSGDQFTLLDLAKTDKNVVIDSIDELIDNIIDARGMSVKYKKRFVKDRDGVSLEMLDYFKNLLRSYGLDFGMNNENINSWLNE